MKYALLLAVAIGFIGCGESAPREYVNGGTASTITQIGFDVAGNPVYVKELVVTRGTGLSSTRNTIFVKCAPDGKILDGTISNSYPQGKVRVDNTTLLN